MDVVAYDLIIIGGGPAGLAAALYALGKRLNVLVIYEDLGGKTGFRQEFADQDKEYPAGAEAMAFLERRVTLEARHILRDRALHVEKVGEIFQITTQHSGVLTSTAVIVATGATPIMLNVPGAQELLNYGLGYSILTYAHLLAGKTVAVIGVTLRALRGVMELAQTAARIYLIAPDAADVPSPLVRTLRQFSNVEVLKGYAVQAIIGNLNVEQIAVANDEHTRQLKVDAVFVDLGLRPNSRMVEQIVQTNQEGFISVDERNATSIPGLYAAGDVTTAFGEQILIAIGDGARAALSAYYYILTRK